MNEAAILRGTMTDRGTFTRQKWTGREWKTETVYENIPCALSRTAQTQTPRTGGQWEELVESQGRMGLFLPAGTMLQAGDRGEIRREGQVLKGVCGACLPYSSHCYTTILVQEVEPA